ncbi:MAG: hypothetical protein ABJE95_39350 [Byssovorax sp.]
MALTWCIGVRGLMIAISSIAFLRQGTLPDVASAAVSARSGTDPTEIFAFWGTVEVEAILRYSRVVFPLSVAQLLLCSMLVIGSGLAMTARRGARNFTLQALAANAVLAGVAYALTRMVRVDTIETVARFAETLPLNLPQRAAYSSRETLWWILRMRLALIELFPFALGLFVLTRPRTKLYFEAVARAAERAEDQ